MPARYIEYVPLSAVLRAPKNPKRHSMDVLEASMARHGFVESPTIDERTGRLVAGHGRIDRLELDRAAGKPPPDGVEVDGDGEWLVPVARGWSSRDDADAAAYLLTSNQATIGPGWELPELAPMLEELFDTALGLEGTGFDREALDEMLAGLAANSDTPPPPDPEPGPVPEQVVTRRGDVWLLGPHRVMCGDCRDPADMALLLGDVQVNVAFTSPPYADRRSYDPASGFVPIPPDTYVEWFDAVQANVAAHLAADGSWFVNIKAGADGLDTELYVLDLVLAHARRWGWHFATEFCWERGGSPQRVWRRFKNQWEPVYQFTRGEWKVRPEAVRVTSGAAFTYEGPESNRSVERHQGDPGNDWFALRESLGEGTAYPGNRLPTMTGSHEATGHTAAFPVGLPAWFVRAYSDPGDHVLDPFLGSGSLLLAAHQEDRVGYGMELSPGYVDVTLARFERHTGIVPVLESTGEPHTFHHP